MMGGTQRLRRAFAAAAALGLLAGVFVVAEILPVSADVGDSGFEVDDGNLRLDGTEGLDWDTVVQTRSDPTAEVSGSRDNSFGQGASEDTACPTVVAGSIPPNKSDLKHFGLYVEDTGDDQFLHMYWTRVQNPSGTTNMDFEFNQKDPDTDGCGNGVTPTRTPGDVLITYNLSKGGTLPEFALHRWIDDGASPKSECEAASSFPCWGVAEDLDLSGDASGSVNQAFIPPGESDGLGALDPFTFGEGTVDLSALLPEGECASFGNAYLKSRSSDSFTSALKDFIAPLDFSITNCGAIQIDKQDSAGAALLGSRFTLFHDAAPTGGAVGLGDDPVTTGDSGVLQGAIDDDDLTIQLGSGEGDAFEAPSVVRIGDELVLVDEVTDDTLTVAADGRGYAGTTATGHATDDAVEEVVSCAPVGDPATCTMVNLFFGDYWLVETTVPGGYTGADAEAVSVSGTTTVEVIVTNQAAPVDISVHKQSDDDDAAPSPVPICFESVTTGCAEFDLHERTTTALEGPVAADQVEIVVADATGFAIGDEIVVHGEGLTNAETMTVQDVVEATLTVSRGDTALTHADDAVVSRLDLGGTPVKGCDPADATEAATGDCTFANVEPGEYWIHEATGPAGHGVDPTLPKAIVVSLGDTDTDHDYTFTNPRLFTVIVLVCSQADDSLYSSAVTFQGETLDTLDTGALDSDLEQDVCQLGGARFEDHTHGDLGDDGNAVDIPRNQDPPAAP